VSRSTYFATATLVAAISGAVIHNVLAQAVPPSDMAVLPQPPLPHGNPDAVNAPPPEWLVWRAFHDSLEFYARNAPEDVRDLLIQRGTLTGLEAQAVMGAGRDYLEKLSTIDDEARAEIQRRYQSDRPSEVPVRNSDPSKPSRETVPVPLNVMPVPSNLLSGRTASGRDLRDVLAANGFIALVEQQRSAAVQVHLVRLRGIVSSQKMTDLEEWLRKDVAPGVAVVTSATPTSPPPGAGPRPPVDALSTR
jgi:hypothetical protein